MFILILNVFSQRAFIKWRQSVCALARDFLQEQDFTERNLLYRASSAMLKLRKTGAFSMEAAPACSHSGEECSGVLQVPRWSRKEPLFPHVVSSDEIAPQEILLLEEIPG
jgi:hypothetical protein